MQGDGGMKMDYNSLLRLVKPMRTNGLSAQLLSKADHRNEGRLGAVYIIVLSGDDVGMSENCALEGSVEQLDANE